MVIAKNFSTTAMKTVGDIVFFPTASEFAWGASGNHHAVAALGLYPVVQIASTVSTDLWLRAQIVGQTFQYNASSAARFPLWYIDDKSSAACGAVPLTFTPFWWLVWTYDDRPLVWKILHYSSLLQHLIYHFYIFEETRARKKKGQIEVYIL